MMTADARCRGRARRDPFAPFIRREQIGAHRHQVAGAAGCAVEPADQFLPPRLGGKMQIAGVVVAGLRAPGLDRLRQLFAVRTVIARQRLEECQPAGVVEVVIAVEHLARHRGAGGLAAAGQQRLAQFDQVGGILFGRRTARRRRNRVRPRSEIVDSRSEKKALAMAGGRSRGDAADLTWDLRQSRSQSSG